ncbi:MAG: hypothetical protein OQK95_14560 [Gammaproteobacteria bacterium]|nr:hypothetical protein [Gammaproteobacteria bacterium]
MNTTKRPMWIWPIILISFVFGALTIKSGGSVIFIDGPARLAAGNYVNFVVWFNFIAGFLYLLAGFGFLLNKKWTAQLTTLIAASTLLIFCAFAVHILMDGSYEIRTVIAMTLRSAIWTAFAFAAYVITKNNTAQS